MIVRQQYYSTKDVMTMLNVSKTAALQIMHMFEQQGKLFRRGRLLRIKENDFAEWIKRNGG